VLRGTTSGGKQPSSTCPPGPPVYVDSSVSDGTVYYYKIRTSNSSGKPATSSELPPSTTGNIPGPCWTPSAAGRHAEQPRPTWTHTGQPEPEQRSILNRRRRQLRFLKLPSNDVSGVTYGGTPMTLVPAVTWPPARRRAAGSASGISWTARRLRDRLGHLEHDEHAEPGRPVDELLTSISPGRWGPAGRTPRPAEPAWRRRTTLIQRYGQSWSPLLPCEQLTQPGRGGQTQVYLEPLRARNTYNEGQHPGGRRRARSPPRSPGPAPDNAAMAAVPDSPGRELMRR